MCSARGLEVAPVLPGLTLHLGRGLAARVDLVPPARHVAAAEQRIARNGFRNDHFFSVADGELVALRVSFRDVHLRDAAALESHLDLVFARVGVLPDRSAFEPDPFLGERLAAPVDEGSRRRLACLFCRDEAAHPRFVLHRHILEVHEVPAEEPDGALPVEFPSLLFPGERVHELVRELVIPASGDEHVDGQVHGREVPHGRDHRGRAPVAAKHAVHDALAHVERHLEDAFHLLHGADHLYLAACATEEGIHQLGPFVLFEHLLDVREVLEEGPGVVDGDALDGGDEGLRREMLHVETREGDARRALLRSTVVDVRVVVEGEHLGHEVHDVRPRRAEPFDDGDPRERILVASISLGELGCQDVDERLCRKVRQSECDFEKCVPALPVVVGLVENILTGGGGVDGHGVLRAVLRVDFSGGEPVRVDGARALAHHPRDFEVHRSCERSGVWWVRAHQLSRSLGRLRFMVPPGK